MIKNETPKICITLIILYKNFAAFPYIYCNKDNHYFHTSQSKVFYLQLYRVSDPV